MSDHQKDNFLDDEIDLKELFIVLWQGKWLLGLITGFSAILAVLYALNLTNQYSAKAILAPKAAGSSMGRLASQYGGIAALAGVSLPGAGSSDAAVAVEMVKSHTFFHQYLYEPFLVNLMAIKKWHPLENRLEIDESIFDPIKQQWIREANFPFTAKPHVDEAYQRYLEALSVSSDKSSGLTTLSMTHASPHVAKAWVELILAAVNTSMRRQKVSDAEAAINYLNQQRRETQLVKLDEVFGRLIEEQTKIIMLASVNENFIFNVIQAPSVALLKSGPNRALICVLGALLGVFIAIMMVLIDHFSFQSRLVNALNEKLFRHRKP